MAKQRRAKKSKSVQRSSRQRGGAVADLLVKVEGIQEGVTEARRDRNAPGYVKAALRAIEANADSLQEELPKLEPPPPVPVCVPAVPSVSILQVEGPKFEITVKNNNSPECAPVAFTLSAVLPTGWSSDLPTSTGVIASTAVAKVQMTVVPTPGMSGSFTFKVSAVGQAGAASVDASLTIQAPTQPPVPIPTPVPVTPSPDGTLMPPAAQLVADDGAIWTYIANRDGITGIAVRTGKDGLAKDTNGRGSRLIKGKGIILIQDWVANRWHQYVGDGLWMWASDDVLASLGLGAPAPPAPAPSPIPPTPVEPAPIPGPVTPGPVTPGPITPAPTPTPIAGVTHINNLSYQGVFLMPEGLPLGFSRAQVACRRVNGELRIFIGGGPRDDRPFKDVDIIEISFPGFGREVGTAPRARLVKNWGDPFHARKKVFTSGSIYNQGLLWVPGYGLVNAYGHEYNTGALWDPSVVAADLEAGKSGGPWRTGIHSQKTRGYMVARPDGRIGFGGPITSGNATSPWGVEHYAARLPDMSAPADAVSNIAAAQTKTIIGDLFIDHGIEKRQHRLPNYQQCGWNVPYDASKGAWLKDPTAPYFNSMDQVSAGTYVHTPSHHGYLYFMNLSAGHQWYGINPCPHGKLDPMHQATGDAAEYHAGCILIYDPNNPVDPDPIPLSAIPDVTWRTNFAIQCYTQYQFGGAAYDSQDRLLFVAQAIGEASSAGPVPIVHVIRVNS